MPYIANPLEGIPLVNTFITDQSLLGTTPATDDILIIFDQSATALKQLTIAELQASITSSVSSLTDTTISSIASAEILKWNGSAWINQTLAEANILPVAGPTFTGVLTVGSAVISEADLEQIDDLTAGTAVASKALVVDGNKDIGTLRNLTIDGIFTDGNYSFDTSGNVTGLGTIGSGNITSTGTIQGTTITATTAFVPDASDGAALGTTALEFSDLFLADGAIIYFGADQDVNITHVADTGLTTDKDFTVGDDLFVSGGLIDLKTTSGSAGLIKFYCESGNAHAQTLQGQPHSATATNVLLLPTGGNSTLVSLVSTDVLTNKTLTAPTINGVVGGTTTSQTITTLTSTTTNAGTLAAAAGSITDSSGAISFGNENLSTTGTLAAAAITASGIVKTDDATEATSTTDGSLQTDGGLSVVKDAVFGNDVDLLSDAAVLSFGADAEVTLTHVADDGLLLNTDMQLQFRDSAINIRSDADGDLDINADDEIELNSTLIDINGNVEVSGTLGVAGALTLTAADMDASDQNIANIKTATFVDEHDNGSSGTSDAIDWREGLKQKTTMTGNCTYTFTAPTGPCNLILACYQDGTARTITWPATVKWPAATAPTFTGTNNIRDIVSFYYDGTHYFGQAALNFPA